MPKSAVIRHIFIYQLNLVYCKIICFLKTGLHFASNFFFSNSDSEGLTPLMAGERIL